MAQLDVSFADAMFHVSGAAAASDEAAAAAQAARARCRARPYNGFPLHLNFCR